jgi:hypothetical protein
LVIHPTDPWIGFEALELRVLMHAMDPVSAALSSDPGNGCIVENETCDSGCCVADQHDEHDEAAVAADVASGAVGTPASSSKAHEDDPSAIQDEHEAVMALVPYELVTHTAISSGQWNAAATWQNGILPTAGANVLVSAGVTVTVGHIDTVALHTIRVDGTLQFDSTKNTGLLVDTIVVAPNASLTIGTATNPIANNVSATITFADTGAVDRTWDPKFFSRGLVSHGVVSIHGADKTDWTSLSTAPIKGATQLQLSAAPTNWKVGDSLVLTGNNPNANEDEQLTIQAISGSTVTVSPLKFNHTKLPASDAKVYLANTTRNIVFKSQNTADKSRRGHVMFMHSAAVEVHNAAFLGLGRSDKAADPNNSKLDADGHLIAGTGTNQQGRYAVHFHRTGTTKAPVHVSGSVVVDSPGWGFVNHSSNVIMEDSVSYNVMGSHFVSEAGDEIGAFRNNIAIRSIGSGDSNGIGAADSGLNFSSQDFGRNGHGFWLQGGGVELEGNVAAGHRHAAYVIWTKGLLEADTGEVTQFLAVNLPAQFASVAQGNDKVDVDDVPVFKFNNNIGFASAYGLYTTRNLTTVSTDANVRSTYENATFYNLGVYKNKYGKAVDKIGVGVRYNQYQTFKNFRVYGELNNPTGYGFFTNNQVIDFTLENSVVQGWDIGINVSVQGKTLVKGGFFNNVKNFYILTSRKLEGAFDRNFNTSGTVSFGSLSPTVLAGRVQYRYYTDVDYSIDVTLMPYYFDSDVTGFSSGTYIGKQLYYTLQAANSVPFPSGKMPAGFPPELIGKTNQQMFNTYGLALGGAIAPATTTTDPVYNGLIGAAAQYLSKLVLVSPAETSSLSGYVLKYRDSDGITQTDSTPVNLSLGWNLVTRFIDGHNRTFFVYGLAPGTSKKSMKLANDAATTSQNPLAFAMQRRALDHQQEEEESSQSPTSGFISGKLLLSAIDE